MARIGLIILAAGASTRFGKPKQLALFKGKTLIQRAIDAALASLCRPVVVVLGANSEIVATQIEGAVEVKINPDWSHGMGSSIRCGLPAIENRADGIIVLLCDQPLVTSDILNRFVHAADHGLAASEYQNSLGVPALFGREFFPALRGLNGKQGARQILAQNKRRVFRVSCPEAAVDIDTPEDLEKLSEAGESRNRSSGLYSRNSGRPV